MENGTRVSDITKKFEDLTTKDFSVREDLSSKRRVNIVYPNHSSNINGPVVPSKSVIKRSNAFRTEKTTKPSQPAETYSFLNSRVYHKLNPGKPNDLPPISTSANPYTRKKPYSEALNERNKIHTELNGLSTASHQNTRNVDLPKVFAVKPVNSITRPFENGNGPIDTRSSPVEASSPQYSTDTLRKVLSSPLPCGPPPRKPPRTFQYGFPLEESLPSTPRSREAIRSSPKESIEARRQLFQRSKTEPTINISRAQPVAVHEIPMGHIQAVTQQLDLKLGRTEAKRDAGLCLRSFCGLSPNKNNPIYDVPFHPARRSPGCSPPNIPVNPP